jgi:aerobic-type carbon monoxide dehydrogenase small subunit (CoxS/CutS family)
VSFTLNGTDVTVDDGISLLDVLRDELHCRSVKDGCSPQGQCGCCTVWVDGAARVACVTPVRRVAGRAVTTAEGLPDELSRRWTSAFVATGASQCGFCTPGIVLRLAALEAAPTVPTKDGIEGALRAHLCRCTGWQSIVEAACLALGLGPGPPATPDDTERDPLLAAWRAQLEGPAFQTSGPDTVLGDAGFADDTSPPHALVQLGALTRPAPSLRAARAGTGRVQGRNSTVALSHPVALPDGPWDLTLQTTWVEPAYLEPDASWCEPGGRPASPLANGGAFGGKRHSPVPAQAGNLADTNARPTRLLWRREDVVRLGPKRPPLALGLRADGRGTVRLGRTPGSPDLGDLAERLTDLAPGVNVEIADIAGPPVAPDLRAAGWGEVLAARHALAAAALPAGHGHADVTLPGAGRAAVHLETTASARGTLHAEVWAGAPLDPITLRSYTLGAVHQALGLVWSEGIAVDEQGVPLDLTIRSFGILPARAMPEVTVTLHEEDTWPVNGSDAVFVATLAAAYQAEGRPPRWPTRRTGGRSHEWPVAPAPLSADP